MYPGYQEIEELGIILQAENCGRQIDHDRARCLALHLAELYPDIARTMIRIADRMTIPPMAKVA